MTNEIDTNPGEVEDLRQALTDEQAAGIDVPTDLMRRRDVCQRAHVVIGQNPRVGATLVPELLALLDEERGREAISSIEQVLGLPVHSAACRRHLLYALRLADPERVVEQLADIEYSEADVIDLVVEGVLGATPPVQQAGVLALDILGWTMPGAVAGAANRISRVLSDHAAATDDLSLYALRLLRLIVSLRPEAVADKDQLESALAEIQDQEGGSQALMADCIVVAAGEALTLTPATDDFLANASPTEVLEKLVIEQGGFTQLSYAELLGYELCCADASTEDPSAVEAIGRARVDQRPGAAELIGAAAAVKRAHGPDFITAQVDLIAENEGTAFLDEAMLLGLSAMSGDLSGTLGDIAEDYIENYPGARIDRAGQAIMLGATLAARDEPEPVVETLLSIYERSNGFKRSVSVDAIGVIHCINSHVADPPGGLAKAFHDSRPGSANQMRLAGACGYATIMARQSDNADPIELLANRVLRSSEFHDRLNPGMVGPTAVALGLLAFHSNYEADELLAKVFDRLENSNETMRQNAAITAGYLVAVEETYDATEVEGLATYVCQHIGVDRGTAAAALGFTLAWTETKVDDAALEMLCEQIDGAGGDRFESIHPEGTIDPNSVARNIGDAARLLGEIAAPQYAPSYGTLAQAADLVHVLEGPPRHAATTVWAHLKDASQSKGEDGLIYNRLFQLVKRGGVVGQIAQTVSSVEDVRTNRNSIGELAKVMRWETEPTLRRIASETLATFIERYPDRTEAILDAVFRGLNYSSSEDDNGNLLINTISELEDQSTRQVLRLLDQAQLTNPDILPPLGESLRDGLAQGRFDTKSKLIAVNILTRLE